MVNVVVFKIRFDLFSALGLKEYKSWFPFIFFFYFFWVNLWIISWKKNRLKNLWKFLVSLFYRSTKRKVVGKMIFSKMVVGNIFFFLLNSKIWKLVPLTVSPSSKIVFTFCFGFFFWIIIKVSRFLKKIFQYFSHFTPLGSPLLLIPFINVIEIVRKVIRPITLGVRLAVKLLTGHLLLSMFSGSHKVKLLGLNFVIYLIMFFFGIFIFFYESCICIIQALVFGLLIKNYYDEHSI